MNFVGGAGFFIQYHDVIKPAYLYAVIKMILTDQSYGLPTNIIKDSKISSILEWYINRRYKNPLVQLDYNKQIPVDHLDELLQKILEQDDSVYQLSPPLNFERMLSVYRQQYLNFPIFIYSNEYEEGIEKDLPKVFQGINYRYLHGDLKSAIQKCDNNFTYIFSDIELTNIAADILLGTYSHILQVEDYRYNYQDNKKTFKYDLQQMMEKHPFIRLGTTKAMDINNIQLENILE